MFAIPITFTGTYCGAILSFIISRYFLREYVKRKMNSLKSSNQWLENFDLVDEIFDDGN